MPRRRQPEGEPGSTKTEKQARRQTKPQLRPADYRRPVRQIRGVMLQLYSVM
jgi:hypothetical protein